MSIKANKIKPILKHINFEELNLPEIVYKYRGYKNPEHLTIITNRIVFMASMLSFEDEMDCRNQKRYDLIKKDEIINKYYDYYNKEYPNNTTTENKKLAEQQAIISPLNDKKTITTIMQTHIEYLDKRLGVLSLSLNSKNKKMWKKYGENHKGFCVGFNTKKLFEEIKAGGGKVKYCNKLPTIKWNEDDYIAMTYQLLFKKNKWKYEDEYRAFKYYPEPINNEKRKIEITKDCYQIIIFGKDTTQKDKELVKEICREQRMDIQFKKIINKKYNKRLIIIPETQI